MTTSAARSMSRNEHIRDSISILVLSTVSTWLFKQPHLTLLGILLTSYFALSCLAHTCELVSLARTSNKATVTLPRLPFIRLALWCTPIAPLVQFGSATFWSVEPPGSWILVRRSKRFVDKPRVKSSVRRVAPSSSFRKSHHYYVHDPVTSIGAASALLHIKSSPRSQGSIDLSSRFSSSRPHERPDRSIQRSH